MKNICLAMLIFLSAGAPAAGGCKISKSDAVRLVADSGVDLDFIDENSRIIKLRAPSSMEMEHYNVRGMLVLSSSIRNGVGVKGWDSLFFINPCTMKVIDAKYY